MREEFQILKTEFKQHFRNVSRIMDCVGCDKCRLWGKMQITGLGTALKLLFSDKEDGEEVLLSRSEAVAFVNTLHRLSESLGAVEKFRELWTKRGEKEEASGGREEEEKEQIGFSSIPQTGFSPPPSQIDTEPLVPPPTINEDETFGSTTGVGGTRGNLSTLPLFCARAIWTKFVDLCESAGWKVGGGGGMGTRNEL